MKENLANKVGRKSTERRKRHLEELPYMILSWKTNDVCRVLCINWCDCASMMPLVVGTLVTK